MLTGRKKKFAQALKKGMTQREAAIEAGYSEKTAQVKGSQLAKDPDVTAYLRRSINGNTKVNTHLNQKVNSKVNFDVNTEVNYHLNHEVSNKVNPTINRKINSRVNSNVNSDINAVITDKERSSQVHDYPDPLAVIAEIMMKNKDIDPKLSLDAAAKLAPYLCSKKGDCGNKDAKRKAAKKAGNRFSPMPPPKLIINNKG